MSFEAIDPEKAITIPLKLKYLVKRPAGFKSKTANQGGNKHTAAKQGWGVRRKAYGPF